ncbi:hypothetical protein V3C99_000844 [Haemonchus contortus]
MSVRLLISLITIAQVWIRVEAFTLKGVIDEELLTYGFIPNSIEGSGFSDERTSDQAETENFACEHSTIALEHRKYILYTHNRLRSKLALGHQPNKPGLGKMGTGRNMYLLRWDCDLELLAHQRIQSCSPHILMNSSRLSGSQLVKHFDIGLQGHNVSHHIEDSMRTWWLQYKRNGNVDPKNRYSSKQLYYGWANMAKGKTTRIGCSYHRCNENMKAIFSCIYSDRAHVENQPIYEQGSPCRTNDDCSTYPRSECISTLGLCKTSRKIKTSHNKTNTMCTKWDSKMTDDCRENALDQHNFYRSRLARGLEYNKETNGSISGAAGMLKMSYDCELERNAQLWADECIFEHSDRKMRPNQGQNLYMTSFLYLEPTSLLHMAIEMWWKELEEFGIPADAILSESFWSSKGNFIGHFTQMAWGETHRVGCAVGNCSNMGLVVCHYSPAGNRRNHSIYKIGKHCGQESNCPRGSFCEEEEALCTLQ